MRDEEEQVLLVDGRDRVIGTGPKLATHRDGLRHRAFSVFLFDERGATLLQARARAKYHSGGLWSNACCGHPRAGERTRAAAERRLFEELGLRTRLTKVGRLAYRAELPGGWRENEIVHFYTGTCSDRPIPDSAEVEDWRWAETGALAAEAAAWPDRFTAWFRIYAAAVPEILFGRDDQSPARTPLSERRGDIYPALHPSRASVVARGCPA